MSQILDDARVYANYAKKIKTIELDDVKLAVHMQMEKSFTTPPPRDVSSAYHRSYMLYISFWMEKHSSVLVLWEKTPQCTNWIYWNIRDSFGILLERDRFQEDSDTFSFISINLICSLWGFLPCFILFFMCRFLSVIVLLMRSLHILFYITENRNRYIETDFSLLLWFLFLD